jgi:hypothetical protein
MCKTAERRVTFYDVEDGLKVLAATPPEASRIRTIMWQPDYDALIATTQDGLKVWGWEPEVKLFDSADVPYVPSSWTHH